MFNVCRQAERKHEEIDFPDARLFERDRRFLLALPYRGFAHTLQIAVRFHVPLVIWGEASSEYRAYRDPRELEELDERMFHEVVNLGINADMMYELLNGG